ncbi:GNAT family N-acetyltransferase [Thiofilum flexile]|uniref:GNAT family N-acetyltransferase n=1 Tax=Thiofilum flexile TaxID=125627 RepID=UPI0013A5A98E|nr:GNAT family N-acetyltransferase [Thiofilum flexile]
MEVARSTGLFDESQMPLLQRMFDQASTDDPSAPFWMGSFNEALNGVIYCEPERMTEGTWNLQLIAVHPDLQRHKIGTSLLSEVECVTRAYGGRILLVDTAGIDEFKHVRTFYKKYGFTEEACIRDFYAQDVDKVTFRKALHNEKAA